MIPSRLPIVGVMGSGSVEHAERAAPRGATLDEIVAFVARHLSLSSR